MGFLDSLLNVAQDVTPLSSSISMTLSGGGQTVEFPILPESFSVSVSQQNGSVNINNAGEYAMIGKTGLKSISFSSFFPAQRYHIVKSIMQITPYAYVNKIETMRTAGEPLNFCIGSTSINLPVLIDSFEYGERDGSRDVYYTIKLREYRYIDGIAPTVSNDITGLMSRPIPKIDAGKVAEKILTGNKSPMQVIGEAIGISKNPMGSVLDTYKAMAKNGGFSIGKSINVSIPKKIVDSHIITH